MSDQPAQPNCFRAASLLISLMISQRDTPTLFRLAPIFTGSISAIARRFPSFSPVKNLKPCFTLRQRP